MLIGVSILEAIDWTQDRLATTRPLAERTLFSLITAKKVCETEQGYVLLEAEEEVDRQHVKVRSARGRMRFHHQRANAKKTVGRHNRQRYLQNLKQMNRLDKSDRLSDDDEATLSEGLDDNALS